MSIAVASIEPLQIAAGDTILFLKSLADYPAGDGWQLKYELTNADGQYEFTSTASGDSHSITVDASATAAWLPGDYTLNGYAVNSASGQRQQVYFNYLTIRPDYTSAPGDNRTHAQKMLALIEAVQLGKAAHDIVESEVETTRIRRLTPKELRDERDYWLAERSRETDLANTAAGRPSRRSVFAAFTGV